MEHTTYSLILLAIVAIVAVIGLVYVQAEHTGAHHVCREGHIAMATFNGVFCMPQAEVEKSIGSNYVHFTSSF